VRLSIISPREFPVFRAIFQAVFIFILRGDSCRLSRFQSALPDVAENTAAARVQNHCVLLRGISLPGSVTQLPLHSLYINFSFSVVNSYTFSLSLSEGVSGSFLFHVAASGIASAPKPETKKAKVLSFLLSLTLLSCHDRDLQLQLWEGPLMHHAQPKGNIHGVFALLSLWSISISCLHSQILRFCVRLSHTQGPMQLTRVLLNAPATADPNTLYSLSLSLSLS
jgi:hypothetical protein